jgi:TRAP-type C4-dicarboxylate transport system permease small subunit
MLRPFSTSLACVLIAAFICMGAAEIIQPLRMYFASPTAPYQWWRGTRQDHEQREAQKAEVREAAVARLKAAIYLPLFATGMAIYLLTGIYRELTRIRGRLRSSTPPR